MSIVPPSCLRRWIIQGIRPACHQAQCAQPAKLPTKNCHFSHHLGSPRILCHESWLRQMPGITIATLGICHNVGHSLHKCMSWPLHAIVGYCQSWTPTALGFTWFIARFVSLNTIVPNIESVLRFTSHCPWWKFTDFQVRKHKTMTC